MLPPFPSSQGEENLLTPGLAASREHCNSVLYEYTAVVLQMPTVKIQVSNTNLKIHHAEEEQNEGLP